MTFKIGDKVRLANGVPVVRGCWRYGDIVEARADGTYVVHSANGFHISGLWESDLVHEASYKREALADISHDIWSHWTRWQFSVCVQNADGSLTIPAALVERWTRQMNTPYADLTEREKDSDREQADKIISVLE